MAFDLVKFNRQVYTVATEIADQKIELFNAASGNAIRLVPSNVNMGDYAMEASFKAISGLVRRRDVNNGSTSVTAVRLAQLQKNSVKVAAGTPPIAFETGQYAWLLQNPAQAAAMIGEQLAVGMVQDQLNTALAAATGAITNQTALTLDVASEKTTSTFSLLTQAAGNFGDRASDVVAWIMHSKVQTDLYLSALANGERLFQFGTINVVRDPFGRLLIVSDSPSLVGSETITEDNASVDLTTYATLGLVEDAALIEPNNDFDAVIEKKTGSENIQSVYQAEWSYNLGLKGYTWDVTNGGSAPSNTAIGTGTNWDKIASSDKDTCGVALVSC